MKSPGIEVRRIKQMSGTSNFNEVFFTDVRVPDSQRLGEVGDGWKVSLTTLMNERLAVGDAPGPDFDDIFALARTLELDDGPAIRNPAVREKLADWYVQTVGLKYTNFRTMTALSRGQTPGPEASIGKLVSASKLQDIASYGIDLHGHGRRHHAMPRSRPWSLVPGGAALRAGHAHRRRHRRDPAQHHRRAGAGTARRHPRRQGRAVPRAQDRKTITKQAGERNPSFQNVMFLWTIALRLG